MRAVGSGYSMQQGEQAARQQSGAGRSGGITNENPTTCPVLTPSPVQRVVAMWNNMKWDF